MARKQTLDAIISLYRKLGGNLNEVIGTKTNVSFLGTGSKTAEPLLDMDINPDAIGAVGKSQILQELKNSVGYATAGKLNDVQASKLLENMTKVDNVFNPPQIANITDLRTGTTDLDQSGLASLRESELIKRFQQGEKTGKPVMTKIMQDDIKALQDDLPPPGSRGGPEDIAAPVASMDDVIKNIVEIEGGSPSGAGLELLKNVKTNNLIINDVVDKIYLNAGVAPAAQPVVRANAREFLNRIKDLSDELDGTTLSSVMEADDFRFMTEGGGGGLGDPLLLVQKYFGPKVAASVAQLDNADDIQKFAENLAKIKDAKGNSVTSRYFDPESINPDDFEFAEGGSVRPGYMAGNIVRGLYTAAQKTAIFKHLGGEAGSNKNFKNLYKFFKNPDSDPALKDKIDDLLREKGLFRGGGLAKILEV